MSKKVPHLKTASSLNIIVSTYFLNKTKANKQSYIIKWSK